MQSFNLGIERMQRVGIFFVKSFYLENLAVHEWCSEYMKENVLKKGVSLHDKKEPK